MIFYFPDLICAGGKVQKNRSTLPGLGRSPPSAVNGLRPGRVQNKIQIQIKLEAYDQESSESPSLGISDTISLRIGGYL